MDSNQDRIKEINDSNEETEITNASIEDAAALGRLPDLNLPPVQVTPQVIDGAVMKPAASPNALSGNPVEALPDLNQPLIPQASTPTSDDWSTDATNALLDAHWQQLNALSPEKKILSANQWSLITNSVKLIDRRKTKSQCITKIHNLKRQYEKVLKRPCKWPYFFKVERFVTEYKSRRAS